MGTLESMVVVGSALGDEGHAHDNDEGKGKAAGTGWVGYRGVDSRCRCGEC